MTISTSLPLSFPTPHFCPFSASCCPNHAREEIAGFPCSSVANAATDADPDWIGTRALRAINWSASGDVHGKRAGSPVVDPTCTPTSYGSLKPPYNDPDANYVLSCTDCHEPHGNRNVFLLRTVVNGKDLSAFIEELTPMEFEGFYEFCTACHEVNGACGPHWWGSNPYNYGCAYCHYHGAGPGGKEF